MHTDIKGWTLADLIGEQQYYLLVDEGQKELRGFVQTDQTVEFQVSAHIVTAVKGNGSINLARM